MVLRVEPIARVLDPILAAAPGRRAPHNRRWPAPPARCSLKPTPCAGRPRSPDPHLRPLRGHRRAGRELYGAEELSLGISSSPAARSRPLAFMDAAVRGSRAPSRRNPSRRSRSWRASRPPGLHAAAVFRGYAVPEVLLSGDHAKIAGMAAPRQRPPKTGPARRFAGEGARFAFGAGAVLHSSGCHAGGDSTTRLRGLRVGSR